MTKGHSLLYYLNKYIDFQEDIMLVYRPTLKDSWGDRCKFLDSDYIPTKKYNHRSLLNNEIVIEYDNDSKATNIKYTNEVIKRLERDNIHYSKWDSGNKSIHLHFFVDITGIKNLNLFKKTIMRYYTDDIAVPDMRLSTENHLIICEYGVHEKTGVIKSLLYAHKDYPQISRLPQAVYDRYIHSQKISISVRTNNYVAGLENHKAFQFILQSDKFRLADDGRERALFMLIHILKNNKFKDNKEGLTKFLQEWYRYSGGYKITDEQIKCKVNYHWKRDYMIGINYLRELLESIGKEDLLED